MVDYDELFVANPADQREWQLPRTPIRDNEPRWLTKMRHQQTRSRPTDRGYGQDDDAA